MGGELLLHLCHLWRELIGVIHNLVLTCFGLRCIEALDESEQDGKRWSGQDRSPGPGCTECEVQLTMVRSFQLA